MAIESSQVSTDIFETKRSFLMGAASYFGLPDGQVMHGSEFDSQDGQFAIVFRVALSADDLIGIAGRMKAMAEVPDDIAQPVPQAQPSDEELRAEYNGLTQADRSKYGSFHVYRLARGGFDPYGQPKPTSDAADFGGFPG